MRQPFTLVGVDIEGAWNRTLLLNAASLSASECTFATTVTAKVEMPAQHEIKTVPIEEALQGCGQILACECTHKSLSIYDFPAPRQKTAILLGNEELGIPRPLIKRSNRVISVPMTQSSLSSLNVGVAAAVILYVLTHDLARHRRARNGLKQQNVDILIAAPTDPYELGSLLRSAYAFGWRRVFLSDPHRVWFCPDSDIILQGRAAARRAKNLLAVLPAEQLEPARYDAVVACDQAQDGSPLSRLRLPECRRLLIVFGDWSPTSNLEQPPMRVAVDHADRAVQARFRHAGSILFSVISQLFCA